MKPINQTCIIFRISFLVTLLLILSFDIMAQDDFVTLSSTKVGRFDKKAGTAYFEENVRAVQKSTGSTLTADKLFAKRDNQTNKLEQAKAEGNVHLIYLKQDKQTKFIRTVDVKCNVAEFDRTLNKAILKGSVVARSHDFDIKADMIYYDLANESGTITELPGKQVQMKVIKNGIPENQRKRQPNFKPEIVDGSANEIRFARSLRKVTFQGKVKFYDHTEQASFSGSKADAYFDEAEKLDRIVAYENVVITQPTRTSTADRAVFNYKTETVVLTGNASVKEVNQMEVHSSTITMHMDEEKGIISGNEGVPINAKVKISP